MVVKLARESLFENDVGLQKFLSDKRIRGRFIAILGLVKFNSIRFKEASYIYRHGHPLQPLRSDKFFLSLNEWLMSINKELIEKEKTHDVIFISQSHDIIVVTNPYLLQVEL